MLATNALLKTGRTDGTGGMYGISATVLIPLAMGLASSFVWRSERLGLGQLTLGAFLNTLLGMMVAYLFLHEGTVCLAMAFPLLFGLICAGTFLGSYLFRPKPGPLAVSVAPLVLALIFGDCLAPKHDFSDAVTTSVRIQAPPAKVFPYTVAFSPINTPPPGFVLNRLGLPWVVKTAVTGNRVGSERKCVFSGDLVLDEKITELEPGKKITFAITRAPRYPEFTEHGTVLQGQMQLTDNGDGTTTLTGTSWYTLHVYPAWYFGPWADTIIHQVHYRVFDHIRELAESDASMPASSRRQ